MTPLPKGVLDSPLVRYVFHPPQASALCFSCTKIHNRADQKLFLEGSKNFRESAFSGTFSSPHTFCTPPYHGPTKERKDRVRFGPCEGEPAAVAICDLCALSEFGNQCEPLFGNLLAAHEQTISWERPAIC